MPENLPCRGHSCRNCRVELPAVTLAWRRRCRQPLNTMHAHTAEILGVRASSPWISFQKRGCFLRLSAIGSSDSTPKRKVRRPKKESDPTSEGSQADIQQSPHLSPGSDEQAEQALPEVEASQQALGSPSEDEGEEFEVEGDLKQDLDDALEESLQEAFDNALDLEDDFEEAHTFFDDDDDGVVEEQFDETAGRKGGYTPYEYVSFTEDALNHELLIHVDAPLDKVWAIWSDRLNYLQWFDLIGQTVHHAEEESLCSYFFFYQWGMLPGLELYCTLERELVERESIVEKSVDGMNFAAAAFFKEGDKGGTQVVLRVAYYLPVNLKEFVGVPGTWAHVNDILEENMAAMKEFVENADLEAVRKERKNDRVIMSRDLEEMQQTVDTAAQIAKEDQLKEEAMAIDFLEHLAELEEQAVETREKGVTKIEKTRRATKNNSISGGTAPRRAQLKKQQETES